MQLLRTRQCQPTKAKYLSSYQGRFYWIKKETGVLIEKDTVPPNDEPTTAALSPSIVYQASTILNENFSETILGKITSMYKIKITKF